ncbi:membrane protein [Candidatus Omnitrophus magneticus]|uniref:Membrane protein n=1 Tax=Candidatus Omnitrophus magneticus TaxID=1609969 RepID=A0A0F0CN01_9BACT|nr:membrane protein [Candidatus Omnitrophus magneticus]
MSFFSCSFVARLLLIRVNSFSFIFLFSIVVFSSASFSDFCVVDSVNSFLYLVNNIFNSDIFSSIVVYSFSFLFSFSVIPFNSLSLFFSASRQESNSSFNLVISDVIRDKVAVVVSLSLFFWLSSSSCLFVSECKLAIFCSMLLNVSSSCLLIRFIPKSSSFFSIISLLISFNRVFISLDLDAVSLISV